MLRLKNSTPHLQVLLLLKHYRVPQSHQAFISFVFCPLIVSNPCRNCAWLQNSQTSLLLPLRYKNRTKSPLPSGCGFTRRVIINKVERKWKWRMHHWQVMIVDYDGLFQIHCRHLHWEISPGCCTQYIRNLLCVDFRSMLIQNDILK